METLDKEFGDGDKLTRDVALRAAMLATNKAEATLDGLNVRDEDDNSLSKAIGYSTIADTYISIAHALSPGQNWINVNAPEKLN